MIAHAEDNHSIKTTKKLPKNFEAILKTFFNHILEGYKFIKENEKGVMYHKNDVLAPVWFGYSHKTDSG